MKAHRVRLVLIAVGLLALTTTLGPRRPIRPSQRLMGKKASLSQQLLTAVVQQEFAQVSNQAQRLEALVHSAAWPAVVLSNAVLAEQREHLGRHAEALRQAAGASDSETMQVSFVTLIRDCCQCHRQ